MKKISIITVNYNDAAGMRATAESVVGQTRFEEIEWIVIDGGSTDGSVEVIREYADKIAYWVSEKDKGIYHAMNKGIAQAHGEYLLFRNSGDLMSTPYVIEQFLQHPVYGQYDHCCGKMEVMRKNRIFRVVPAPEEIRLCDFFGGPFAMHPVTFIKRERFSYELYDEEYKIAADTKFLFKDIILRNASYAPMDFHVGKFAASGISAQNTTLSVQEENRFLQEYLPIRIYEEFKRAQNAPGKAGVFYALARKRTWEYRALMYLAWLLCLPRYVLERARRLYQKIFKGI